MIAMLVALNDTGKKGVLLLGVCFCSSAFFVPYRYLAIYLVGAMGSSLSTICAFDVHFIPKTPAQLTFRGQMPTTQAIPQVIQKRAPLTQWRSLRLLLET
jgi:hypothetical protein